MSDEELKADPLLSALIQKARDEIPLSLLADHVILKFRESRNNGLNEQGLFELSPNDTQNLYHICKAVENGIKIISRLPLFLSFNVLYSHYIESIVQEKDNVVIQLQCWVRRSFAKRDLTYKKAVIVTQVEHEKKLEHERVGKRIENVYKIQRNTRRWSASQKLKYMRRDYNAARAIQSSWRAFVSVLERQKLKVVRFNRNLSARKIQAIYRMYKARTLLSLSRNKGMQ